MTNNYCLLISTLLASKTSQRFFQISMDENQVWKFSQKCGVFEEIVLPFSKRFEKVSGFLHII